MGGFAITSTEELEAFVAANDAKILELENGGAAIEVAVDGQDQVDALNLLDFGPGFGVTHVPGTNVYRITLPPSLGIPNLADLPDVDFESRPPARGQLFEWDNGRLVTSRFGTTAKWSNTNNTTNLNGTNIRVPIFGNVAFNQDDSLFQPVSATQIRVVEEAVYTIKARCYFFSSVLRTAVRLQFRLGGGLSGAIDSSGYIRASSGHNRSSCSLDEQFYLAANTIVELNATRDGNAGTVRMNGAGESMFQITRGRLQ